jgi:recombinase/recombinase-like zinc beta ribbon protein
MTEPKRRRGSYHGGPGPNGYDFDPEDSGMPVVNEPEAAVVRRIFKEYNEGRALRAIARGLNEESLKGPLGGAWSQARVADRLDMPLYVGLLQGGYTGRHDALIDQRTWDRTRELRDTAHERAPRGGRHANAHLLGHGLLRCECGASMYPRTDTRSGRDTYRCRGRDERTSPDCTMPPLPRAAVDGAVRAFLAQEVMSPELARGEIDREATRAAAEARREARRVAQAIAKPSPDLLAAVEAIRNAAADEAADAQGLAAQRLALGRIFDRFEAERLGDVKNEDVKQDAFSGGSGPLTFGVRGRGGRPAAIYWLKPVSRAELAGRMPDWITPPRLPPRAASERP